MLCVVLATHSLKEGSGLYRYIGARSSEKFVFTSWEVDISTLGAFKSLVGARSTFTNKSAKFCSKNYFYKIMNVECAGVFLLWFYSIYEGL